MAVCPDTSQEPDFRDLDVNEVERQLYLPPNTLTWLPSVDLPVGSAGPMLPDDAKAAELLERLGVDPVDRSTTLAARPDPLEHSALWWVLDRAYRALRVGMGVPPAGGGWPALPVETGSVGRHLYVWVGLAALPYVRRYHSDRDVSDEISWASLATLGEELASARRVTGLAGLEATWGMPRIFSGVSYRLGRMAFDRQRPSPESPEHPVLAVGQCGLNVHIPGSGGRLDPHACEDSLDQARAFFPQRFPEQVAAFGCHSWLMDDQLGAYLPESSNILRFQRRFTTFVDRELADWAPLEHIFHRRYEGTVVPALLLDDLPQQTALQRAIVTHLRSGRHWYNRTGWMTF